MKSAQKTRLKRLIVAVASREARITGERQMYRAPAWRWPRSTASVAGSTGEIERSMKAETRKETASAISAPGAERSWTRRPPTLEPPMNEKARLPDENADER